MRDYYYWRVWVEVVVKRGCEVYAESATIGEANVFSGGEYEKNVSHELVKYYLSYSTLL